MIILSVAYRLAKDPATKHKAYVPVFTATDGNKYYTVARKSRLYKTAKTAVRHGERMAERYNRLVAAKASLDARPFYVKWLDAVKAFIRKVRRMR